MIIYVFLLKINFDSCFIYLNIYIKKNFMYFIFFFIWIFLDLFFGNMVKVRSILSVLKNGIIGCLC